jgi:hypothetical protein
VPTSAQPNDFQTGALVQILNGVVNLMNQNQSQQEQPVAPQPSAPEQSTAQLEDQWKPDQFDPTVVPDETGKDTRYNQKQTALKQLVGCNTKWFGDLIQAGQIPNPQTTKIVATPIKPPGDKPGVVTIVNMKTDEAINLYSQEGTACIWNCARGSAPLGGYYGGHGQKAQEENVARLTTLCKALTDAKSAGMYPIFDGVLYTTGLSTMRFGEKFEQLPADQRKQFSAISTAAPNMQGQFKGKEFGDVSDYIEEKLDKMFLVPEEDILIAAGWGVGSFAPPKPAQGLPDARFNYIEAMATTIAMKVASHRKRYLKVVFAMPDDEARAIFENVFNDFGLL